MSTFAWSETYSVHVKQLDAQHQVLFSTINLLAEAMRGGRGAPVVRDVVQKLVVYTQTHFQQEEVLMKRTGYSQLAEHKAQHARLMASVGQYQTDLNAGRKPNTVAVLRFLQGWLIDHIRKSDKAYSAHLNAHGIH